MDLSRRSIGYLQTHTINRIAKIERRWGIRQKHGRSIFRSER
jgi:hypothetical protein